LTYEAIKLRIDMWKHDEVYYSVWKDWKPL
jgi:hypothetical protein